MPRDDEGDDTLCVSEYSNGIVKKRHQNCTFAATETRHCRRGKNVPLLFREFPSHLPNEYVVSNDRQPRHYATTFHLAVTHTRGFRTRDTLPRSKAATPPATSCTFFFAAPPTSATKLPPLPNDDGGGGGGRGSLSRPPLPSQMPFPSFSPIRGRLPHVRYIIPCSNNSPLPSQISRPSTFFLKKCM